jgi:tetratricopeptide (TPR) repeat protein
MGDDGKLLDDLGNLDWDSALDDWEKNAFVPEVAREAETNALPLPEPPLPAELHPGAPAAGAAQGSLKDVSSEGTVIAPVPRELRAEPRRLPTSSPPLVAPPQRTSTSPSAVTAPSTGRGAAVRGGLGQLFAKSSSQRPPPPMPPPRPTSQNPRVPPRVAMPDGAPAGRPFAPPRPFGSRSLPGLTRQVAVPAAVPPQAYGDSPLDDFEDEVTLAGRGVEDAEQDSQHSGDHARLVADAPTVATREVEEAAADHYSSATVVADRAKMESLSDAAADTRHREDSDVAEHSAPAEAPPPADASSRGEDSPPSPADDDTPTGIRRSPSKPSPAKSPAPVGLPAEGERPPAPTKFTGEQPVSRWLDPTTTTAFRQRASWLEEEARAIIDPVEQARALLGVSELLALSGDETGALALATEARDRGPDIALAWRQARQLLPRDAAFETRVEALDAEAAHSPTPAARAHAMLMAADVLRANGDGEAAVQRWKNASKLDPSDVRAPAAGAALALSQNKHSGAGNDLAENSELVALDRAMGIALKLRGAPRPGTDVDSMAINDAFRRARSALAAADVVGASQAIADIAREPVLSKAALWLSAAFGATHIAGRRAAAKALKTLVNEGEPLARRALAARGIELGDPELVSFALGNESPEAPIEPVERATLLALASQDPSAALGPIVDQTDYAPLVDALSALRLAENEQGAIERSRHASGHEEHRALGALGRLLASGPSAAAIDFAVAAVPTPRGPAAAGVGLEVALMTGRWDEVSEALSALPTGDDSGATSQRHIAAALVAERTGNHETAKRAWREALAQGAAHDSVVRAVARLDQEIDLAAELLRIAEELPEGTASAVLRLEALARRDASAARPGPALDDDEQGGILERVHRGAPTLGIGAFLAERMGRRKGDVDEVLRWIQERRSYANDPLETALDAVREALLVADRDADLASTRLEEAHRGRPDDVALRELYERLATEAPADRGAWREQRAEKATGATRALLFMEAAIEHERAGDYAGALRAAHHARDAGDAGLSRPAAERAEIETGSTERQTSDLMALARETESLEVRRETYERLAELDARGKKDGAAALMWHMTILEETPHHKPSLRHVEHALIGQGRDAELEPVFEQIALALDGTPGGEVTGHAQLAARLRTRVAGGWERTGDMARLAATQTEPSLWGLRALNAHARVQKDEDASLATTIALLERTQRPTERAALLLRASEAAARLEHVAEARAFLEQAADEDPGDVVTWGFLAEIREQGGETRAAAEACESLARTSVVPAHQLLAWFDAARIWLDEVKDSERGMSALEQCAEIDVAHADVFPRLSALYAEKQLDAELARLLEKRLVSVEDEGERVALQVELSRALVDMGELGKAKLSLESALAHRPDHTTALAAMAELCSKEGDWTGAELAYVRLARLLDAPAEQREIYEKLGEIYGTHTGDLSRAEVAYKEVLKRGPNDIATLEKLVELYKRKGDLGRAVETQQQIVAEATDPAVRLSRLIELASIHEASPRDARRAEQVLESARKEFPTSVVALRAMAEFYTRQRQMPAMQILLDRAASDARRSFTAGRFVTSLFEVLHSAYELRGRKDAARVVAATLAAVEGQPGGLVGAEARAVDPRLDDLLAPEIMGPALRALLQGAGDSLDAISPLDLRSLRASPLVPGTPLGTTVGAVATVVGLGALHILVSPQLGRVAVPLGTNPPALLVGEGLMTVANERARTFMVVRAMKMILSRASSLFRGDPAEVAVLVSTLFTALNPSFVPQGVDPKRVSEVSRRLLPALPRNLDPTVGVIALEAAGTLGNQAAQLGAAAQAWANRVALLAIGDPNGALDALAWSKGEEAAPRASEERAAWIARNAEARELMTFSVSDAYFEGRSRLGLER